MNKFLLGVISCLASAAASAQGMSAVAEDIPNGSAINVAVSKPDETNGNTFFKEAEELEMRGNYNDALMRFGKAAFEYSSVKDYNHYNRALIKMSNMHFRLKRYMDAEQILLNVVVKYYAKIGSTIGLMNTYGELAKVYLASDKFTQALWFYTQQGILARQLNHNPSHVESVLGIAGVKIKKKEFGLAAKDLNKAEMLANAGKSNQFKEQIKALRAGIPNQKNTTINQKNTKK